MGRIDTDAFVLAGWGPDKGFRTGRQKLELAVRLPDGRLVETKDNPKVPVEQWIVPGMTVPVSIDPGRPDRCDVRVEGVPALADRMAGSDWALLNREEVIAQIRALKFELAQGPEAGAAEAERAFADAARKHADRPQAPVKDAKGRLKGMAHIISFEELPSSRSPNANGSMGSWHARRLVRIWLYGYAPYAVMDEATFKRDGTKCYLKGGVPVAVDPEDLYDFEYLWDEWEYDPAADLALKIATQLHTSVQTGSMLGYVSAQHGLARAGSDVRVRTAQILHAWGALLPADFPPELLQA